jgi:dihydropteroate synthase
MFAWSSVCGERPAVMGIVNVTPDSFSDGGRYLDPDAAVAHGLALVAAGADVLDVGGESTRPGAEPVDEAEERRGPPGRPPSRRPLASR